MLNRLLSTAISTGLLVASQASSAVLLTTPEQSADFCVGVCALAPAGSGVIEKGPSAPGLPKNESTTATFSTFNSSLGILKSAKFTLTSSIVGAVFLEQSVFADSTDELSLLIDPKLSLPGFDVLFDAPVLPNLFVEALTDPTTGAASFSFKSEPRNASATFESPPTNLSFFTTGSTFNAEFLQRLTMTNTQSDNDTLTGNATWSGTLKLQYAYEERPTESVPEPGTLALVGLGLLSGVAGLRKRNSKAG